ncbi:hypothetical protein C1645_804498 [Glomus cerebriforme]|uniref:Crinkler effector protein N-terminal domain-containing protein n=1 Tax=Glomus cerebriforme TaxID=658196 RepID=A0A397T2F8_9GLOM|nr:hypothetical protein C1645_804498 [Glomus cerebriforme]
MSDTAKIRVFCLVLGETPVASCVFEVCINKIDSVSRLKNTIKNEKKNDFSDIDANKLRLWKVNIPIEKSEKMKILNEVPHSAINIEQEFGGEELFSAKKIQYYFHDQPKDEHIHIIVKLPTITTANWKDSDSILKWIQRYRPKDGTKPVILVESFGHQFNLCSRENTISTLWNGNLLNNNGILKRFEHFRNQKSDRNLHPIPFLCCGPGTGKSRFLQEIHGMLLKQAQSSENQEIAFIFENAVYLNVTYGNGSAAANFDVNIKGEASLALRILYNYFIYGNKTMNYGFFVEMVGENAKYLRLSTVLQAIYKSRCKNEEKLVIVVGIDEVNKLYDISHEDFYSLINSIGTWSCSSGPVFFIPILAGTNETLLQSTITKSTHQILHLPLNLLSMSDMLLIACSLGFNREYIYQNHLFRCIIADIGGHVRALELFYELISNEAKYKRMEEIDLARIVQLLEGKLLEQYQFYQFTDQVTPMLANAILERPVRKNDGFHMGNQKISYERLNSLGMLTLEPVPDDMSRQLYYIRLPYIWICLLIKTATGESPYKFLNLMINPKETFYCEQWEKFNIKFWILRICLFSVLGKKTIKLKELLNGTLYSNEFMDIEVKIPDYNSIQVHYPNRQYSLNNNTFFNFDDKYNSSYTNNSIIYKNGNADYDGFSYLIINSNQPMLLALQLKWKNSQQIDDKIIKKEYEKVEEVAREVGLDDWLLLILSNCSSTFKKSLPPRCAIVDKNHFTKFYGNIFSYRAQIAAQGGFCINSRDRDDMEQETELNMIDEFDEFGKRKFEEEYNDDEDLCIRTKFPRLSLDCTDDRSLKPSIKILMY